MSLVAAGLNQMPTDEQLRANFPAVDAVCEGSAAYDGQLPPLPGILMVCRLVSVYGCGLPYGIPYLGAGMSGVLYLLKPSRKRLLALKTGPFWHSKRSPAGTQKGLFWHSKGALLALKTGPF